MAKKTKQTLQADLLPDFNMTEIECQKFILKCLVLENGSCPFEEWLRSITDMGTRQRIQNRLDRVERGNLGECRSLGSEISELKLDFGPGYRIYFARTNKTLVVLLVGGSKDSQENDIKKAKKIWKDTKNETQRYERDLQR